jgi:signal transduction histidine kinase
VVSEALTNAAKHAQASVVHVDLDTSDATPQLTIRDDGIGGALPSQGSGLLGLRDRIEALGGTLHITSSADNGTILRMMSRSESRAVTAKSPDHAPGCASSRPDRVPASR